MWKEVMKLWAETIRFQAVNFFKVLPILPFLFLPFAGNLLHSIVVRQYYMTRRIERAKALGGVWPFVWPYMKIKMRFTAIETLTDPLPLINEIVDVRYAQYSAMISNVIVFENLVGKACILRCKELVRGKGVAVRATFTAPVLLWVAVLILWAGIVTVFQASWALLVLIMLTLYIFGPLSGTTNSLLYLLLTYEGSVFKES